MVSGGRLNVGKLGGPRTGKVTAVGLGTRRCEPGSRQVVASIRQRAGGGAVGRGLGCHDAPDGS